MDLLQSLNLDALPEQQTRTSHPLVRDALTSSSDNSDADPIHLGINACCTCASTNTSVVCTRCRRVKYCSDRCRRQDADPVDVAEPADAAREEDGYDDDEGGDSAAQGHSAVVCALLRLCNADESAEETIMAGEEEEAPTAADDDEDFDKYDNDEDDAAASYRVRSELESYPATLANVLMDGPCYQQALSTNNNELTILVVGASDEAELWNRHGGDSGKKRRQRRGDDSVYDAYAEAFSQLFEHHPRRLSKIKCSFVGPDCPQDDVRKVRKIRDDDVSPANNGGEGRKKKRRRDDGNNEKCIVLETYRSNLDSHFLRKFPHVVGSADVVVFFNPGFTCPDYDWSEALSIIAKEHDQASRQKTTEGGCPLPFLVTTNTELEGMADCQYLYNHGYISTLPPSIADLVAQPPNEEEKEEEDRHHEYDQEEEEEEEDATARSSMFFFGENPYAGSRVRQSSTMANDLFVKSRWMFGGMLCSSSGRDDSNMNMSSGRAKKKRKSARKRPATRESDEGVNKEDRPNDQTRRHSKKKASKASSSSANTKKKNPALI